MLIYWENENIYVKWGIGKYVNICRFVCIFLVFLFNILWAVFYIVIF